MPQLIYQYVVYTIYVFDKRISLCFPMLYTIYWQYLFWQIALSTRTITLVTLSFRFISMISNIGELYKEIIFNDETRIKHVVVSYCLI